MKLKEHRGILVLGLGTVVVLIAAGAWMTAGRSAEGSVTEPSSPRSAEEPKVVLSGFVDLEGGIIPLYPLQPGRIEQVLVKENQQVKAGAELIRLDDRLARLKLQQAEADLAAAEAKLGQAREAQLVHRSKIDLQKEAIEAAEKRRSAAMHKVTRSRELVKDKFMSKEEVAGLEDLVKEAEVGVRAEHKKLDILKQLDPTLDLKLAEANLQAKKAQREEARYGLDERVVRARADGIVLRINVGPGEVLGPIPQEPAILFAVDQQRIIRFNVEQEFAAKVKVGSPAEVRDYLNPQLGKWTGKVTRVSDVFMQTRTLLPQKISFSMDETRTLEGVVALDPNQPSLRLGQRVRVIVRPEGR